MDLTTRYVAREKVTWNCLYYGVYSLLGIVECGI